MKIEQKVEPIAFEKLLKQKYLIKVNTDIEGVRIGEVVVFREYWNGYTGREINGMVMRVAYLLNVCDVGKIELDVKKMR